MLVALDGAGSGAVQGRGGYGVALQSKPSANIASTSGAVTFALLLPGTGSVVSEPTDAVNGTGSGAV